MDKKDVKKIFQKIIRQLLNETKNAVLIQERSSNDMEIDGLDRNALAALSMKRYFAT